MLNDKSKPKLSRMVMTFEEYDAGIISTSGRTIIHKPPEGMWSQDALEIEDVTIQFFQDGGANSFDSIGNDNLISFGFVLQGPNPFWTNGVELNEQKMVVVRPGDLIATRADGICNYCVISFPFDKFLHYCRNYDLHLTQQLMDGPIVQNIAPEDFQCILAQTGRIVEIAQPSETFQFQEARVSAIQDLLAVIIKTVENTTYPPRRFGRPSVPQHHIINRIREYLTGQQFCVGNVSGLASFVGISERKLRQDVESIFGLSPKKLLALRKMHEIRTSLRDAKPGQTVTEIAGKSGMWEIGRFACNYQKIFNELPSETLKKNKK